MGSVINLSQTSCMNYMNLDKSRPPHQLPSHFEKDNTFSHVQSAVVMINAIKIVGYSVIRMKGLMHSLDSYVLFYSTSFVQVKIKWALFCSHMGFIDGQPRWRS